MESIIYSCFILLDTSKAALLMLIKIRYKRIQNKSKELIKTMGYAAEQMIEQHNLRMQTDECYREYMYDVERSMQEDEYNARMELAKIIERQMDWFDDFRVDCKGYEETGIKAVDSERISDAQVRSERQTSTNETIGAIKHCQICQTYQSGLKECSGQMACAKCREKAASKQLAKAQISFWDDQPPMFRM